IPDIPSWLAVALVVLSLLVPPLFTRGNERGKRDLQVAEGLRDDMMRYSAQVKADSEATRQQNGQFFSALVDLNTSLSESQGFVLRRSIAARIDLDQKDFEGAANHLDELIGGTKKLDITAPYWTKEQ